MISTRQLAHALALAEHRSFRHAAQASHLSQPALSRSISALEAYLGVQLFDRTSEGVELTIFGEAVVRRGRELLDGIGEIEQEINVLRDLRVGSCSLALGVYPAALTGAPALGRLVNRFPNLRFRARTIGWREITAELLERRADLGLGEISTIDEDDATFATELVGTHRLVFYCRSEHPLARARSVSTEDIDRYPLAMIRLPPRVADLFPGQGKIDEKSGDLLPSVEVDDLDTARRVVLSSDSIGLAVPTQIADYVARGKLCALPFFAPWLHLQYGFVYRRDRLLSPAASAFMDEVRSLEAELVQQVSACSSVSG